MPKVRDPMRSSQSGNFRWRRYPTYGLFLVLCLAVGDVNGKAAERRCDETEFIVSQKSYEVLVGRANHAGGTAFVEKLSEKGRFLLRWRFPEPVVAQCFPILEVTGSELPAHLEMEFFWVSEDGRGPSSLLAPPLVGKQYLSLIDSQNWRGKIVEFGFVLRPAFGMPPLDLAVRDFSIDKVALRSANLSTRLGVWLTDYLSPRYWSSSSINSVDEPWPGRPTGADRLQLSAVIGVSVLLIGLLLSLVGSRRISVPTSFLLGISITWFFLHFLWMTQVIHQVKATLDQYAGLDSDQIAKRAPDGRVFARVNDLKGVLATHGIEPTKNQRVIVYLPGGHFLQERLFYHLLPYNAAPIHSQESFRYLLIDDILIWWGGQPTLEHIQAGLARKSWNLTHASVTLVLRPIIESDQYSAYRIVGQKHD